MRYLHNLAIAVDQLIHALIGGAADETLSAAAYRSQWKSHGWWLAYKLINFLFFWQHDHCQASYQSEQQRRHLPEEYHG